MKLQITAAGPHVLRLSGDLDLYTVESAREALLQQFADKSRLELDLGGVETCDASGVQLLLAARRSAEISGKSFSVHPVSQAVSTCGELLGMAPGSLFSNAR